MTRISIKRFFNSDFVKNTSKLISGNIIAQIILVGTIPILTRLYTPENFGLFALYTAIVGIISSVSSLCYDRAILLPKENKDAKNLFFLSSFILIAVSFLTSIVVLLLNNRIADIFSESQFSFWILFVPIGVLLTGFVTIFKYWRLRNKQFKLISFSRVSETSASVGTKILIGFFIGAYCGGLIAGAILGTTVALFVLVKKPMIFTLKQHLVDFSTNAIYTIAKTYKKFPYFASWNSLLNVFSRQLIILMFSFFFLQLS